MVPPFSTLSVSQRSTSPLGWPVLILIGTVLSLVGAPAGHSAETPANLRQPLIVPVSRTASGLFQNVHSALEAKQYKEAARLLTTSYALREDGLIAAPTDNQLLVSYRGMQQMLLHDRKLVEAMSDRLDAAAQLKVEQVLSHGDPAAVEALSVEFYGTPVHASACQWLGDRALAGADFRRALSWFEEGRLTASAAQQPDLAARERLTAAMLGDLRGEPPTRPILFGDAKILPEQFERHVHDAVTRQQAKLETASLSDVIPILPGPHDVRFRFLPWAEFDGDIGPPGQVAVAAGDDTIILSSRNRVAAFDPATGKTRWNWHLGKSSCPSAITLLIVGQRVYMRSMVVSGKYGITCLDKKTGRLLWRRDCGDHVAGDPQMYQGRLYILALGPLTDTVGMPLHPLSMVELNPENGEILARTPVAHAWPAGNGTPGSERPPEYRSICVGNRLLVMFCGAVACIDLRGKVQWLRNSEAIPPGIDSTSQFHLCQMPRESGGRLYLQQPGNCAVQCLKVETGELVWRRGILGLQQILDFNDDRILVRTTYGLTALHAATGDILWRRELPGMLYAVAGAGGNQVFCARQINQPDKSQLVLLWIDLATGKTKAHSLLPLTFRGPLILGPIIANGNQAWCCSGRGIEGDPNPNRPGLRIFAMRPSGPAVEGELP